MKYLIFLLFFYFSLISKGQESLGFRQKLAYDFYNNGVQAFRLNKYIMADSLFSQSLNYEINGDALFNRGILRFILNDTCSGCSDLFFAASGFSDKEALGIFYKTCVKSVDTTYYDKKFQILNSKTDYKYYDELLILKCDSSVQGYVHKKNHNKTHQSPVDYRIDTKNVDIIASYSSHNSLKYYDFIYFSTFEEDNKKVIEKFKSELEKFLNSKYNFEDIPYKDRYCTVTIYINPIGETIDYELNENPFYFFDKSLKENIKKDIVIYFKKIPQLKPALHFEKPVNFEYTFYFGI